MAHDRAPERRLPAFLVIQRSRAGARQADMVAPGGPVVQPVGAVDLILVEQIGQPHRQLIALAAVVVIGKKAFEWREIRLVLQRGQQAHQPPGQRQFIQRGLLGHAVAAQQELSGMFADQGLTAEEAQLAASLLLHETFARSMENLQQPEQLPQDLPAPFAHYLPRYAFAPEPGALEQGRQFATLHSVLLNGAPLNVVSDFVDYETEVLGPALGQGPDGDTALMAAVANPDAVSLLLQRGFDPNAANAWGKTPLMVAAEQNQIESMRRLLAAGANVHAETTSVAGIGVGGPDRREAAQGRQWRQGRQGQGYTDTREQIARTSRYQGIWA